MQTVPNLLIQEKNIASGFNKTAYQVATKFLSSNKENVLVIQSKSGNGDGMTTLASSLAHICIKDKKEVYFQSAEKISQVLNCKSVNKIEFLILLSNVDYLFIDDVNFLYSSNNQCAFQQIRKIIHLRCIGNYKTVLTSCLTENDHSFNTSYRIRICFAMINKPNKTEKLKLLNEALMGHIWSEGVGVTIELSESLKKNFCNVACNIRHLRGLFNKLLASYNLHNKTV